MGELVRQLIMRIILFTEISADVLCLLGLEDNFIISVEGKNHFGEKWNRISGISIGNSAYLYWCPSEKYSFMLLIFCNSYSHKY